MQPVARCVTAREGQRLDYETETLITHALRGEGFDASEDGTGRGTPIIAIQDEACRGNPQSGPGGKGWRDDGMAFTHQADHVQAVCFNITPSNSNKDFNARQSERAQALTAGGNRPSARGGDLIADTLASNGDAHSGYRDEKGLVHHRSAVRRLTPIECERLQGFPDNYTLIPGWRRGAAKSDVEEVARWIMGQDITWTWERALEAARHPDGPRYKALGNSMAVPVMSWIGERIAMVEALGNERLAA